MNDTLWNSLPRTNVGVVRRFRLSETTKSILRLILGGLLLALLSGGICALLVQTLCQIGVDRWG